MKTSNIIILSVAIFILIGVFVNAYQIKNMYHAAEWSDPLHGCIKIDIPAVKTVYIKEENSIGKQYHSRVEVIKGQQCMFATPDTSEFKYAVTDSGLLIVIKAHQAKAIIVLPALERVQAENVMDTRINNIICDSLLVQSDQNSSVSIDNCRIGKLKVQNDGGKVVVKGSNTVREASVRLHDGKFVSENVAYEQATYDADNTSSVELKGKSVGMFR